MYEHHLKDQVERLIKAKVLKPSDSEKALKVMTKYWEDKIAIVWCAEDVQARAKEQHKGRVSKANAIEILQTMLRRHDCTLGITWDTIDCNLEE